MNPATDVRRAMHFDVVVVGGGNVLAFEKDGRLFYPVGNANIQTVGGGRGLVEMLYGIAERKGVEILYETPVMGRIAGAHAASDRSL